MACRSSFIQTYPSASCLQTGLMSLSAPSATSLPGITVGTAISTVHAFRLADYTADRDSHPALKICRCKFITIYDNSYTNILHIHKFYHTFASLNQKVYHFGYSQQQSNTAKTQCPDGGIGRRAGLKHQWSNPCRFDPGSGYRSGVSVLPETPLSFKKGSLPIRRAIIGLNSAVRHFPFSNTIFPLTQGKALVVS